MFRHGSSKGGVAPLRGVVTPHSKGSAFASDVGTLRHSATGSAQAACPARQYPTPPEVVRRAAGCRRRVRFPLPPFDESPRLVSGPNKARCHPAAGFVRLGQ